jgi:hypothetical protein
MMTMVRNHRSAQLTAGTLLLTLLGFAGGTAYAGPFALGANRTSNVTLTDPNNWQDDSHHFDHVQPSRPRVPGSGQSGRTEPVEQCHDPDLLLHHLPGQRETRPSVPVASNEASS